MDLDVAIELGRRVLLIALFICAPMMVIGLIVGVTVSLIQAVTQVQEMTLTFVRSRPTGGERGRQSALDQQRAGLFC